ncbi:hypothetical protein C2G38_2034193 [Gigaspora rosea]|uniref:C2H2-type domain-containing protein n=1 Tax=Gigaspora rosea TaxID=44941 RepID=A0A397VGS2_9GLOM|nr:hypothetical protein C2G38_2034193 [Gigaspora rosea]
MATNDLWSAFGVPIVLISNYALEQEFKCEICRIMYKTKRGLNRHQSIVQKYNIRREGLCVLPFEAVNQFKKDLTYIIDAYMQLASIFNNQNWGRKFFDNDQQMFILLFDEQVEKKNNRKKKSEFPKLMIEWKTKYKKDAKSNQTSAGYMYLNFYTLQIWGYIL